MFVFLRETKLLVTEKTVTGRVHRQQSQTTVGHASACGLLGPPKGSSYTLQTYKTKITGGDGERGGIRRKSISA